jgi:hypothetical protein
VNAAAVTVDCVIETDVRTIVVSDDVARLSLFKHFERCLGRLANPLDRVAQPGIWRVNLPHKTFTQI